MIKYAIMFPLAFCLSATGLSAHVVCDGSGLTPAQCRLVAIVGHCSDGRHKFDVEEGRVYIESRLIGTLRSDGQVVDEEGEMVTTMTQLFENSCS